MKYRKAGDRRRWREWEKDKWVEDQDEEMSWLDEKDRERWEERKVREIDESLDISGSPRLYLYPKLRIIGSPPRDTVRLCKCVLCGVRLSISCATTNPPPPSLSASFTPLCLRASSTSHTASLCTRCGYSCSRIVNQK